MAFEIGARIKTCSDEGLIAPKFHNQLGTVVGTDLALYVRFDNVEPPGIGRDKNWEDGGPYPWTINPKAILRKLEPCPQCETLYRESNDYLCHECRYGI